MKMIHKIIPRQAYYLLGIAAAFIGAYFRGRFHGSNGEKTRQAIKENETWSELYQSITKSQDVSINDEDVKNPDENMRRR